MYEETSNDKKIMGDDQSDQRSASTTLSAQSEQSTTEMNPHKSSFDSQFDDVSYQSSREEGSQRTEGTQGDMDADNSQDEESEISVSALNSNIVKNILKAFFNYLIDIKNKDIITEMVSKKPYNYTMKIIKKFIKQYKFNNYFLIRLLKNKGYKKVLEYYLTFDASEWMYNSKITDIPSHVKCIEFLKECCTNEKILEQINTYKKKS